jgi:hypothetical protein
VNDKPETNQLEIADMYCCAYLHACGVRLIRPQLTDWGRVTFLFADDGTASRCLGEWRARRAFCDARAYAESLRFAKRLLMATLNTASLNAANGTIGEKVNANASATAIC